MVGSLAERHVRYEPQVVEHSAGDRSESVGVIGLGYVGLPLMMALSRHYGKVVGFDIDTRRIEALQRHEDWTGEIARDDLRRSRLELTHRVDELVGLSIYIVSVPTPVDASNRPDFGPLKAACRALAAVIRRGSIVVFESTVHPGATEEICAAELARYSGLRAGREFFVGYSPERISPGDSAHGLRSVTKVVAAQTPEALDRIARLYEAVVPAGVHRAPSIRVAEAAKVFENTQRDVNIALLNEFSEICDRLNIRTRDVVDATATKWNALPFTPGLVGGHCIGVDPFYLTARAEELGAYPEIMLASRRRNETMPREIARRAVRFLGHIDRPMSQARIGILGLTFKENVPDARNSKIFDVISELRSYGANPMVNDPLAMTSDFVDNGLAPCKLSAMSALDLMILAVPHASYIAGHGRHLQDLIRNGGVLMDIRSALDPDRVRDDLVYWGL